MCNLYLFFYFFHCCYSIFPGSRTFRCKFCPSMKEELQLVVVYGAMRDDMSFSVCAYIIYRQIIFGLSQHPQWSCMYFELSNQGIEQIIEQLDQEKFSLNKKAIYIWNWPAYLISATIIPRVPLSVSVISWTISELNSKNCEQL